MRTISPRDIQSYSYAETGYANPHAVTEIADGLATTTYAYDNNGNVITAGEWEYGWDYRNRLISAGQGTATLSYAYDHTEQRIRQVTSSATTTYVNRLYNVASSTFYATTTKHIFSPGGQLLATIDGNGTAPSTYYIHSDHLGGTNVVTDPKGDLAQTLDYYPYGSQRIASGSFDEQRRFIGEEYDGDTEFSYLNARYYQGSRGQFMSQDPVFLAIGSGGRDARSKKQLQALLADPQLLNAYSYSKNSPLVLVDKGGEIAVVPLALIGIKIYGAYNLGYHLGKVLNAEKLFPHLYSPQERSDAWFAFGYDALTEAAGLGLTDELGAFLTLSSNLLDGLQKLDEAGEEYKKKYGQSRVQGVTVDSRSSGGSSVSGSSYAYPSVPRDPVGADRSRGLTFGALSGTQQSALQSLSSSLTNFDAQAFVRSLQTVLKAFEVK